MIPCFFVVVIVSVHCIMNVKDSRRNKIMKKDRVLWIVTLVLVMLAWGSTYPASKHVMDSVSPLMLAFVRYLLSFLFLVPFFVWELLYRKKGIPSRSDTVRICGLGVIGVAAFSALVCFGIELSSATSSSLLVNTQPIITVFLAPLLIREHISKWRIMGACIGIVGMFLVVTNGRPQAVSFADKALIGNLLLLGSALCMSLYSILLAGFVKKYGSTTPTFISMFFGTCVLFVVVLVRQESFFRIRSLRMEDILLLLHIGFIGTGLAFLLANKALSHVGVVSSLGYRLLIPVFGALLSVTLIGERPGLLTVVGIFIVIAAIFFMQTRAAENKVLSNS